ncbi:MAG: hypothetical protein LBQ14_05120 [Treponema sp.]|jgi:hypothetical protein|nr:hypothetical protein [Treponema sp.]
MKRHSRHKAAALIALLCLVPWFAAAQTRTEEEVDTGRFGAEEPEDPGTAAEEEDLYAKWLRLGVRAGPSFRFYTPADDTPYTGGDTQAVSVDLAFQANLRVLPYLSVQAELVFTWDNASLWAYQVISGSQVRYTMDYTSFSLQFPFLVKYDFYAGRFRISPFAGLYFIAPLGKLDVSSSRGGGGRSLNYSVDPPLGFLGGLSGAVKAGSGAVIVDLRYAADLGTFEGRGIEEFRRSMVSLTVGYEFGFFAQKKGGRP